MSRIVHITSLGSPGLSISCLSDGNAEDAEVAAALAGELGR